MLIGQVTDTNSSELLSYMEEVLPEKKELDTEIVLDTMINVNEFLKN